MSAFKHYLDWNKAFLDYFFTDEVENIILSMDDNLIETIGKDAGIELESGEDSYLKDFYKTILDRSLRDDFVDSKNLSISHTIFSPPEVRIIRGNSIFAFAAMLGCKSAELKLSGLECPALSYFIFAVNTYQGDVKKKSQWINTTDIIHQYAPDDTCQFPYLEQIAESIEQYDDRFDSNAIVGGLRYVGRIKYHMILQPSQRESFRKFLIQRNFEWNPIELSYEECVNSRILPYIKDDSLIQSLVNPDNYFYFKNFIETFRAGSQVVSDNSQIEATLFAVFTLSYDISLSLHTDIKVVNELRGENFCVPVTDERSFDYYPVTADCPCWEQYPGLDFEADGYRIKSQDAKYFLFELYESDLQYLVQRMYPVTGQGYYIVSKLDKEELSKSTQQTLENIPPRVAAIWGAGWNVYHIDSWYRESKEPKATAKISKIRASDGVTFPNSRKQYFSQSLPYLTSCTMATSVEELSLYSVSYPEEKSLQTVELNDSSKPFFIDTRNTDHIVEVRNDKDEKLLSFAVKQSKETHDSRNTFEINRWGLPRQGNEAYYSNNEIPNWNINENYRTIHINTIWSRAGYSHQKNNVVTMLKAYDNEGEFIRKSKLQDIIKYMGLRNGVTFDDNRDMKSFVSYLISLGYMEKLFQRGTYTYQMTDPKFVRVAQYLGSGSLYVLYGSYTEGLIHKLENSGLRLITHRPYTDTQLKHHSYLSCLPDFILVNVNKNDVLKQFNIPVIQEPIGTKFLDFCGSMKDFARDFKLCVQKRTAQPDPNVKYPILTNVEGRNCIETRDSLIFDYQKADYTFAPVPYELMKLYVLNEKKAPVCISRNNGIGNHMNIYFTKDMGVPPIMNKALCLKGLMIPEYVKAFGVGDLFGSAIISELKRYNTSENELEKYIPKLTGKRDDDDRILRLSDVNAKNSKFEMFYTTITENQIHEHHIRLFHNGKLLAVALFPSKEVYCDKTYYIKNRQKSDGFLTKVNGTDPKQLLSNIITGEALSWSGKTITYSTFDGKEESEEVMICKTKTIKKI